MSKRKQATAQAGITATATALIAENAPVPAGYRLFPLGGLYVPATQANDIADGWRELGAGDATPELADLRASGPYTRRDALRVIAQHQASRTSLWDGVAMRPDGSFASRVTTRTRSTGRRSPSKPWPHPTSKSPPVAYQE